MDVKSLAQRSDWIPRSQPVDYREPLSASDIKNAVAFFRISFPFQGVVFSSSPHAARALLASEE
ncbi:hypothetical protein, partial [Candidatus Erwinia dacicola]|uniref:hypothetical protein n=1 Tax=Candidatus Erwinia dacicola TaxID=252393 RepID=UPI003B848A93